MLLTMLLRHSTVTTFSLYTLVGHTVKTWLQVTLEASNLLTHGTTKFQNTITLILATLQPPDTLLNLFGLLLLNWVALKLFATTFGDSIPSVNILQEEMLSVLIVISQCKYSMPMFFHWRLEVQGPVLGIKYVRYMTFRYNTCMRLAFS